MTQVVGLLIAGLLLVVAREALPPSGALVLATLAGAVGALGLVCFYLALSRGTMGLVAPLTALIGATVPALVGIAGGDEVAPLVLAGMVAALAAVFLIAMPGRRFGAPAVPTFHGSRLREWLLIVLAGLGFAGFFLGVDLVHDAGGDVWWPLLMVKLGGVASAGLAGLLLITRQGRRRVRSLSAALMMASIAGVGDLGGNLFYVIASGVGDLAIVVVLASLYPLGTAFLARIVLHERLGPVRLAGVALAVAGVMLIGLGSL